LTQTQKLRANFCGGGEGARAVALANRLKTGIGMSRCHSRRDILNTGLKLAAAGSLGAGGAAGVQAREGPMHGDNALHRVDEVLRGALAKGELPGVVALAATESGILYEGVFGRRRLADGPAMTRDTVFRIASMVKAITSVAALQLVEKGKLSLEVPVPEIEPALNEPQVLDGFSAAGAPRLRAPKRPISLHHLLTHTSGFTYRLWDAKRVHYAEAVGKLPAKQRNQFPHTPLMFDPGEHWQYGPSIDWVGRIVQAVSGEPIEAYFRKNIFEPLGMKDTGFVISAEQRGREASVHRREADGSLLAQPVERQIPGQTFTGGGGIYSTAADYLTFLRMLMHGGALDGVRILSPETVARMGENQIGKIEAGILKSTEPLASRDIDFFPGISLKWGFGHMINMQPVANGRSAGSLTWAGLFNTYYWIDPAKRVAAVFMTQVLPFGDERALRVYRDFERCIYAAVG
jgi:CubicO group peptidase (beta-lactamase class C family)